MTRPRRDPPLDDAFHIVTQMRRIVRAINLQSQELSRQVGLTVPQLVLLRAIGDQPPGTATATTLRETMEVNAATMSGLVDRLARRGLLSRQRSQSDRRVVYLGLTDAGRQALSQAPSPLQEQVLDRLADLPADERGTIISSLERLVELMDAEALDASPLLTPSARIDEPSR